MQLHISTVKSEENVCHVYFIYINMLIITSILFSRMCIKRILSHKKSAIMDFSSETRETFSAKSEILEGRDD
jgi:hypothetical protein